MYDVRGAAELLDAGKLKEMMQDCIEKLTYQERYFWRRPLTFDTNRDFETDIQAFIGSFRLIVFDNGDPGELQTLEFPEDKKLVITKED